MSIRTWDVLSDHAPVLVDRFNVGHRPVTDGAACGTGEQLHNAVALQAAGWSTMPCVDPQCWAGRRPW